MLIMQNKFTKISQLLMNIDHLSIILEYIAMKVI